MSVHETPFGARPVDWAFLCEQYRAENVQLRAELKKEEQTVYACMEKLKLWKAALEEIADDPTGVSFAQAEIAKRALGLEP